MLVDTVRVELTYSSELPNEGRDNYPIVLVPIKEGLCCLTTLKDPRKSSWCGGATLTRALFKHRL